ncbi:MAG: rod shape-determining protein MreC [Proteobacteria bacterium]|nr:rod shape-determining protein MreC [Pseudomonadota bacterium]HQR03636.1 rod shape-determining protein MreC [Rhodocyclaceae bacterium]
MNVVGHTPPPFFKRGPAPLARLTFFVALSVLLLVADLRFHTLEWMRLGLATAAWPLQQAAYLPVEAGSDLEQYFRRLTTLQGENQNLHHQQLETAGLLLRQHYLEDENRRLRTLLDMQAHLPVTGQVADILYSSRDPFSHRVVINKGMQQGMEDGQAVIDELGVIGQVTRVFPLTAEVTLLTDKDQAIPIQIQRNGLRAVLAGAGNGMMELRFLAANAEVRVGDILVTSGLDGVYLPGLPVARVVKIDRDQSFSFARIQCAPIGGVERHGQVLVLGHREALPPRPEEPVGPADTVRGKRSRRH